MRSTGKRVSFTRPIRRHSTTSSTNCPYSQSTIGASDCHPRPDFSSHIWNNVFDVPMYAADVLRKHTPLKFNPERLTAHPAFQGGDLRLVFLQDIGCPDVVLEGVGSHSATQMRIRLRDRSWRFVSACSVSPAIFFCATWRLKSVLWVRCLAMDFRPLKPRNSGSIPNLHDVQR
jgi:hypothetical protein